MAVLTGLFQRGSSYYLRVVLPLLHLSVKPPQRNDLNQRASAKPGAIQERPERVLSPEDVTVTGSMVDMYSAAPVLEFQPVDARPTNPESITNEAAIFI